MFYEGNTLQEIKAYRYLEGELFDFGEGPMKMEGLLGSEDAYYEIDIQEHEEAKVARNYDYSIEASLVAGEPKAINIDIKHKDTEKNRLLKSVSSVLVSDKGTHLARVYRGKRSRHIKKQCNKRLRRAKNVGQGGHYRKITQFWRELY